MKYQTIVLFVLMIIVYSILSPSFFTAVNLRNVFSQNASLIIVSMAQLLPQILNGVDLSVSAVVAFAGTTTALLMTQGGMGFFAAAIVAVALSACCCQKACNKPCQQKTACVCACNPCACPQKKDCKAKCPAKPACCPAQKAAATK